MYFNNSFNAKEIGSSMTENGFAVFQNILDNNLIDDLNNTFDNEFMDKAIS